MPDVTRYVWVFNGARSNFPSAVFERKEDADQWIAANHLTGVLTQYPVNISAYDWAIEHGLFRSAKPEHQTPEFIGRFSCANMPHFHYEEGTQDN